LLDLIALLIQISLLYFDWSIFLLWVQTHNLSLQITKEYHQLKRLIINGAELIFYVYFKCWEGLPNG
jgi:hypothetical protein